MTFIQYHSNPTPRNTAECCDFFNFFQTRAQYIQKLLIFLQCKKEIEGEKAWEMDRIATVCMNHSGLSPLGFISAQERTKITVGRRIPCQDRRELRMHGPRWTLDLAPPLAMNKTFSDWGLEKKLRKIRRE